MSRKFINLTVCTFLVAASLSTATALQEPEGVTEPSMESSHHGAQSVVLIFQGDQMSTYRSQVEGLMKAEQLEIVNPELLEGFPVESLSDPSTAPMVMEALMDTARETVGYLCMVKGSASKPEAWLYNLSSGGIQWQKELTKFQSVTPQPDGGFYEAHVFDLAVTLFKRTKKLESGSSVMVPVVGGDNGEHSIQRSLERAILDHSDYLLLNRDEMDTLGKEQLFNESPFVDPDKAVQMGRLVGARYLFIAKAESNFSIPGIVYLKVRLRVVDVETGGQLAEAVSSKFAMHIIWWIILGIFLVIILVWLMKTGTRTKQQDQKRSEDRKTVSSHQKHIDSIEAEAKKWSASIASFRKDTRQKSGPDAAMVFLNTEKRVGLMVDRLHTLPRGSEEYIADPDQHLKHLRRVEDVVAELSLYILNKGGSSDSYCQRVEQQLQVLESVLNEMK